MRQAGVGDGVDKEHGILGHTARPAQAVEGLQRLGKGDALDLVQCPLLPRQLHDGGRGAQGGQVGAHQRLVGVDTAVRSGNNWLEVIRKQLFIQHFMEQAAHLGFLCVFCKKLQIEFGNVPFFCFLYLVHCEIRIFFQRRQICTVFRIPGNSAGKAKGQFTTTWQLQGCI